MKRAYCLKIIQVMMVISLLLTSCRPGIVPGPTRATTVPSETQKAQATEQAPTELISEVKNLLTSAGSAAPQVVSYLPAQGSEVRSTAAFELKFDQAMDTGATQSAFQVTGPEGQVIKGRYAWPSADHLVFQPVEPLKTASSYEAKLDVNASSHTGVGLARPFSFRITTVTPLGISQVSPADGVDSVDPASRITVVFNQPVVALGIQEDQATLPQPVQFSPAVKGQGEWVNTSVYVFTPDVPLNTGSEYTATIAAGLQDATGDDQMKLAHDFTWKFTTRPAGIKSLSTGDYLFDLANLQYVTDVSPTAAITVEFLQEMDRETTEKAVEIRSSSANLLIPFSAKWDPTGKLMTVKPLKYLGLDTDYSLTINPTAQAVDGGHLGSLFDWKFRTIPAPQIIGMVPAEGDQQAQTTLTLRFASPMSTKSLEGKVIFNPPVKNLSWWYSETNEAYYYGLEPSTDYSVTILAGMLDRYGNAINTPRMLHFTTAPLIPQAGLQMPYNPLYRVGGEQNFYLSYVNVKTVTARLYHSTAKDYMQSVEGKKTPENSKPDQSQLVWEKTLRSDAKLNQTIQQAIALQTENGEALAPGFFLLTLDSPEVAYSGPYLDSRILIETEANVTFKNSPGDSLAWVTDPQTGKPISGVPLNIYTTDYTLLGKGVTDENGLVHISTDPENQNGYSERYVVTDSTASGKSVFTFADSSWQSGVYPEDFGIQQNYSYVAFQTSAYVYTDRPIYRPGQPVYFKGIVRQDDDLHYQLPQFKEVQVVISSFEQEIDRQTLSVDEFGSFSGQLTLDSEAALGAYTINVTPVNSELWIGSVTFSVAEYRKPEFQIALQAAPENLAAGDSFKADLSASYYSGGALDQANVDWTLRSDPYSFTPPTTYSRFSFYDDSRDGGVDTYREGDDRSKIIASGSGTTDSNGKLSLDLTAGLPNAADSRQLTLEMSATDFSGNAVSAQTTLIAHKAAIYAGVRPNQYVGSANEAQSFDLVALDWDGKPISGQKMSVVIMRREWYSVQEEDAQGVLRWKSNVKDITVATMNDVVTDDKGLASVQFTPEEGGVYRALVKTSDSAGRVNQAAAYQWVAGQDYIPWRQNNDRTFQLVANRDSYQPGDTAEILIASPYQGSTYALVTVERGKVRSQEVLLLTSNSTIYHLKLTPDMAPGVFVSVVVVKGIDDTNPRPGYKVGMAKLNISAEQQQLKLDVTPDQKDAGPGDTVTYQVKTTGSDGKGVRAEVSLGLSDLATLSLVGPNSQPIMDYFYGERSLSVGTALSIAASIEDFNAALQQQIADGQKAGSGGGKGDGSLGVLEVRQNFPDTAFWQADVVTDDAGAASVTVTLPDNLTTWRMDARAVTTDTRVGQVTDDIVSSRPLLVRPQTPRFFVAGDEAVLSAAIHNNTGKSVDVNVVLEATGAEIVGKPAQSVTIESGKQALVTWKVQVPQDAERVDLIFRADGGGYQDASRPTLGTLDNQGIPVYHFEAPETVGTSGALTDQGSRVEGIRLPSDMNVTTGTLKIQVDPSLAAGLTDGLSYLEHYPYECTEQTVSRFLPNILSLRALQAAGTDDADLKANLQKQIGVALQKIYSRQNSDGGWGWWSGTKSDALTSAYVILALVEAQQADLNVDQDVLNRGLDFLTLQSDDTYSILKTEASSDRNRMAFIGYVLARAGKPNVSRAVQMYDQREWLDQYALAFLAQTVYTIDPQDPRLETLRSELSNLAVLSATGTHWQEHSADPWNWNTDTRTTAIVLDTLIQIDPHNAINANAVRWLMLSREDGHWGSTQETVWAIKALSDWLVQTDELKADYVYGVALNGKSVSEARVNRSNLKAAEPVTVDIADLQKDATNQLAFARTDGPGSMYYTTHLTVNLPVPSIEALDQGIALTRRYYRPEDLKTPVTKAAQGDVLTVQLTIVASSDLHYLVIDDPFPAGLEAVDASLKSSPQNEAPENQDWLVSNKEGWGWWYFTHAELNDEKLVLSSDYLPAGTYVYTYQVRASTPGNYQVIPPTGQEFYFPEVYGRGDGSTFTVNIK